MSINLELIVYDVILLYYYEPYIITNYKLFYEIMLHRLIIIIKYVLLNLNLFLSTECKNPSFKLLR